MSALDVAALRARFPALAREQNGRPVVYLDGPAGSQVPRSVIDAVAETLAHHCANTHGCFATSREVDAQLSQAREALADLLCAPDPEPIAFGPNMTTLALSLSRALAREWKPGDEILLTRADHDANVWPWVLAARDVGATVRYASVRTPECEIDLDSLRAQLGPRTRLVAISAASNAVGTVHPVSEICALAREAGAESFVDAVHYAPHGRIDVEAWGCDYLACSAYKFFGPHIGLLWGRPERLAALPAYQVRPAQAGIADRWSTGTQSHEAIAGARAAVDYLASLTPQAPGRTRRQALDAAFEAIEAHERALAERLERGLRAIEGVRLWGQPARRAPTFGITSDRHTPRALATALGERGIFVWDGHFYALEMVAALGLESDGLLRIGLLHYNTADEVDRLLDELRSLHSR